MIANTEVTLKSVCVCSEGDKTGHCYLWLKGGRSCSLLGGSFACSGGYYIQFILHCSKSHCHNNSIV